LSNFWSRSVVYLCKKILQIDYEIVGKGNIPEKGNFLITSNHQSAWETFFFTALFRGSVFILKDELKKIPIFSGYFKRLGFIFIKRDEGINSIRKITKSVSSLIKQGKSKFIIFPQGTRIYPNEKVKINSGFFAVHKMTGVPILPVVHNSGKFWLNKRFSKVKGTIKVVIYPIIKNNRNKDKMLNIIERRFDKSLL
jgi:1-acyl-sn-glycerol-3-phosphate acyltransferase